MLMQIVKLWEKSIKIQLFFFLKKKHIGLWNFIKHIRKASCSGKYNLGEKTHFGKQLKYQYLKLPDSHTGFHWERLSYGAFYSC